MDKEKLANHLEAAWSIHEPAFAIGDGLRLNDSIGLLGREILYPNREEELQALKAKIRQEIRTPRPPDLLFNGQFESDLDARDDSFVVEMLLHYYAAKLGILFRLKEGEKDSDKYAEIWGEIGKELAIRDFTKSIEGRGDRSGTSDLARATFVEEVMDYFEEYNLTPLPTVKAIVEAARFVLTTNKNDFPNIARINSKAKFNSGSLQSVVQSVSNGRGILYS